MRSSALAEAMNVRISAIVRNVRLRTKWAAFGCKFRLQAFCAITTATRPRFGSIDVTASAAGVGILDFGQVKILFPVRPFLVERRFAITDLNPLHATVFKLPRL